jgi:hypothetical protein
VSAAQPRQYPGCRSRLLRELRLGLELKRSMLRRVRQHPRMAAGRVGTATAEGAAHRFGIGSALRT